MEIHQYIIIYVLSTFGVSRSDPYKFHEYHNLSTIYSHITDIVDKYPLYLQLDHSFKSRKGLSQLLLRIANFSDSRNPMDSSHPYWNSAKVRVLFSYGEHAREFFPVESLFYLLHNLTQGLVSQRDSPEENFSRLVLTKMDIFTVVMMNPDGRQHIENTQNFCWRGTSTGVDLNRNFDWNYGGVGSSLEKGNEELRGDFPFSEPECQVLLDLTLKYKFDIFISFHSGIKEIYLPFADSKSKEIKRKPSNFQSMMELAASLSEISTPAYVYGQAFQLLRYPADGTIFDFMAGKKKIPFAYAIELWGGLSTASCFDLFNPSSGKLEGILESVHPLYEKLFMYLIEWKERHILSAFSIETDGPSLTLCFIMLGLVITLTAMAACNNRFPEWMRLYPRRRIISLKSLSSTLHVS